MIKSKVIPFLLAVLILGAGCSSEKKGLIPRSYHTFVSLFNGYYNANELYKEGRRKQDKSVKMGEGDFMPLLPVEASGASEFDKAIEKCDVIIFRHKNGAYVDNSYYLKGRCDFFKARYSEAIQNFEFVLAKYEKSKLKPDVLIWLAKSYYQSGNRFRAKQIVERIYAECEVTKKRRIALTELEVTMLLKEEKYADAIPILEGTLPLLSKKRTRARYTFLIAQLHDKSGNFNASEDYFARTIKYNADDELNFLSRLSIAQLYVNNAARSTSNVSEIIQPLVKLLKEAKYDEYKDLVYFQIAKIERKANHIERAIANYKASLANNGGREKIRIYSYSDIGSMYFYNKQLMDSALAYFDSAAAIVPDDFPDARQIRTLSSTLKRYKICRTTVRLQDSLLTLASLTDAELKKRIAAIVEKEEKDKEELKRRQEAEAQRQQAMMQSQQFNQMNNPQQQVLNQHGGFYFDDPTRVTQGKATFSQTWGRRRNEDDWRRRTKQRAAGSAAEPDEIAVAEDPNDPVNGIEARKKKYFERAPRTEEDKNKCHEKIKKSLLELANLYHQKLSLPDSSVKTYDDYIRRYPTGEFVPKAYYAIYTIHHERNNPAQNRIKQLILDKYPNTVYAKLLRKEEITASDHTDEDFAGAYRTLFGLFQAGDYETARNFSGFMLDTYLDHDEIPKVYYTRGLCYGYLGQRDTMKKIFQLLKSSFPEDPVTQLAVKTLGYMEKGLPPGPGAQPEGGAAEGGGSEPGAPPEPENRTDESSPFAGFTLSTPQEKYIVVVMIGKDKAKKTELAAQVNSFTEAKFKADKLTSQVYYYTDKQNAGYHLVYISSFSNVQRAEAYIQELQAQAFITAAVKFPQTDLMFASPANFREAFTKRRFDDYAKYYLTFRTQMLGK